MSAEPHRHCTPAMAETNSHRLLIDTFPRSLPIRKSLPIIPEDVYLSIFEFITQPERTYRTSYQSMEEERSEYQTLICNLTLVCRFFATVFIPVALRSMSISFVHGFPSSETLVHDLSEERTRGKFVRALLRKDSRACTQIRYVKECTLTSFQECYGRFSTKAAGYLVRVTDMLPCTVVSLSLKESCIADEYFVKLGALKNLTSLTFWHVTFSSQLVFPQGVSLRLKSFSLFDPNARNGIPLLAVLEFLSRFICSGSIRALHTDSSVFLEVFMNRPCAPFLQHLEFGQMDPQFTPTLLVCLSQMPSLITVSISSWFQHTRATPATTKDLSSPLSMPSLRNLHCPAFMAASLVPGRPLHEVDLYHHLTCDPGTAVKDAFQIPFGSDSFDLFHLMQQSTASIKTLAIPAHVYFSCARLFSDAFPHLNELTLRFPDVRDEITTPEVFVAYVSAICTVWSAPLPPLTQLCIVFGSFISNCQWCFDPALQVAAIASIHFAFPSLRNIIFAAKYDDGWKWRLRSGNTGRQVWEPSIGRITRETIRQTLGHHPVWYPEPDMDPDGIFPRLVDPPL